MRERGQHTQNIISAHGLLALSYESFEKHFAFEGF
jgi:hypothetical protein